MPISNQYVGGTVEKQWVRILTVDTRTRRIDAQLKDYGVIQVAVWEIPTAFRWPKEGEWWLAVRENGIWFLRAPRQNPEADPAIEDLDPGDSILGADGAKIHILGDFSAPDSSVKATVRHGNNQNVERPNYPSVEWIGAAEPINAAIGDTWIGSSADSNIKGCIYHGTDGDMLRPEYPSVEWIGSATPNNALEHDTWIDPD